MTGGACFCGIHEVAITLARAYPLRAEGKIRTLGGMAALRAGGATGRPYRIVCIGLDGAPLDASMMLGQCAGFP